MTPPHRFSLSLTVLISACVLVFIARAVSYSKQDFLLGYDSANYAAVADNIVKGRGFSVDFVLNYFVKYPSISHPEDRRVSISSLFIAGIFLVLGKGAFAAKLLNIFLGTVSIPLSTYLLASSLSSPRSVALLAGLSTIFIHNLSEQTYTALADLLFAQFFLAFVVSLLKSSTRPGWNYAAGLWAGLAVLTKTQGMILLPIWLIYPIAAGGGIRSIGHRHFLGSLGLCLCVMLPLLARNFLLFGDPLFTTIKYNAAYDELFDTQTLAWEERVLKVYWDAPPPDYSGQIFAGRFSENLGKVFRQLRQAAHLIGNWFLLIPLFYFFMPAARKQRALVAGLIVYTLIISVFFAFHQRYEIPLIPVLVALAWGLLYDLIDSVSQAALLRTAALKPFTSPVWIGIFLAVFFLFAYRHDLTGFREELSLRPHPFQESLIDIAKWARDNLPRSAVVMTHDPPLFNFYSGLKCIQIPYDSQEAVRKVARHYGVTHAVPWTVERDEYIQLAGRLQRANLNILLLNPDIPYASIHRIAQGGTLRYANSRLRLYAVRM